eukprot:m.96720 g.96720  ORF g.96720 m.96720 type:complete len:879 (+) comp8642_c0_seq2:26-2662(+)
MAARVAVLIIALAAHASGQAIRTVNGTIVLQIGTASLTLTDAGTCAAGSGSTPYSPAVSQADLQAALAAQVQPQISAMSARTDAQLNTSNTALALAATVQESINVVQATFTNLLAQTQTTLLAEINATNARAVGQLGTANAALAATNTFQQALAALQQNMSSAMTALQATVAAQLGTANAALGLATTVQGSCNAAQASFNASISQVQAALQQQISDANARITAQSNTTAAALSLAAAMQTSVASLFNTLQLSFNTSLVSLQSSLQQQISSTNAQIIQAQNTSIAALTVANTALTSLTRIQSSYDALQSAYVALLQNYSSLQLAVNTMQVSITTLQNQALGSSGGYPVGTYPGVYADMYYASPSVTISVADASAFGVQMLFNRISSSNWITVSPSTGNWRHAVVGIYVLTVSYRQNSGSDIWTVFAVTKDGPSQAVGVSARTGSADTSVTVARVVYAVDSTTSTYQLQQWAAGTKTVCGGTGCFSGGPPGWTNYGTLSGGFAGDTGRMIDITVVRLGDSETVSPTPTSNSPPQAAFANFYYMNTATFAIADSSAYGVTMPLNRAGPSLRITANTATNTWTHALTGTYVVQVAYRQQTGGDSWTVLAVTKDGSSNAVGVSARTGSTNSNLNSNHRVVYTVDSTTSTYQLQHWATAAKTVVGTSGFGGGPPQWGYYGTLCGGTSGDTGRPLDFLVYRLGDSETVNPTNVSFSAPNSAFANMYYVLSSSSINVADTSTYGAIVPFNRAGSSQRIQLNAQSSTWTHSLLGTYVITVAFRQASGADQWTVFAVTKAGSANAAGISSRDGSTDLGMVSFHLTYTVDSTTASYQLQQWATNTKTVCGGSGCFTGGPPQWANYSTYCGGLTGDTGRSLDLFIVRIGD